MTTYYLDCFKLYTRTQKRERRRMRDDFTPSKRDRIMRKLLRRQNSLCFYCGIEIGMNGHVDHVIPIYHGGCNTMDNLVASCRPCNLTKSVGAIEISNPETIEKYLTVRKIFKRRMERYIDGEKSKEWVYDSSISQRFISWRVYLFKVLRED